MPLSTAQFISLCERVTYCARSLASCRANETANESRILSVALSELCHAEMARKSEHQIEARRSAIKYANHILARRHA
jgi:hypothetical protein